MRSLFTFNTPPGPCGYLPEQTWSLFYEVAAEITAGEYEERLKQGWRRFGYSLFHPECPTCRRCKSLRVPVATFQPNRSQKRALAANEGEIRLKIGRPSVTNAKMELYGRFHEFQHGLKGWPKHGEESPAAYSESFVENPFPTEEWCYYLGEQLVGVGYVDALPDGLSAIYFFYDPDLRDRSLGTFNVLRVLREAARRRHSHVYLGYFVEGCRSLEYKGRFRPNEVILPDGTWVTFRD